MTQFLFIELAGKDEMEMTKADMYVDGIADLQQALFPIIIEKDDRLKVQSRI